MVKDNLQDKNKKTKEKKVRTKLTEKEKAFCIAFIKTGSKEEAYKQAYDISVASDVGKESARVKARPQVSAEIERLLLKKYEKEVADAREVLAYFTSVMRGEVKDQFGLDAPIAERTKAAVEMAKRTVDLEISKSMRQEQQIDNVIKIQVDWKREDNRPIIEQEQL